MYVYAYNESMNIASDVTVSMMGSDTSKRVIVIDLTNDIITSTKDFLELLYSFRELYIHEPVGIWLNLNQAYVLAREQLQATGTETDPKELAHNLETFMGYKIFIRGRDA